MGSRKGRGNQHIQFIRFLYCKLPTNGKQLPALTLVFPNKGMQNLMGVHYLLSDIAPHYPSLCGMPFFLFPTFCIPKRGAALFFRDAKYGVTPGIFLFTEFCPFFIFLPLVFTILGLSLALSHSLARFFPLEKRCLRNRRVYGPFGSFTMD